LQMPNAFQRNIVKKYSYKLNLLCIEDTQPEIFGEEGIVIRKRCFFGFLQWYPAPDI
jgi:hypothetical protein